jgi:hypothetical protein
LLTPEHGQPGPTARPGPARKWPGPIMYFGPTGRAWAAKCWPDSDSGRAWAERMQVLVKARPDGPTARWNSAQSGRAWAEISGPTVGPGRAWAAGFLLRAFSWPGPTRPGPKTCPGITSTADRRASPRAYVRTVGLGHHASVGLLAGAAYVCAPCYSVTLGCGRPRAARVRALLYIFVKFYYDGMIKNS